jgi:two-component system nitrate/nitrite response regulator NarL
MTKTQLHIVITDDHQVTRFGLMQWATLHLSQQGIPHTISDAASGGQALELVRSAQSSAQPVSLLVIDVQLPDMTGLETVKILRQEGFQGTILMVSGSNQADVYDVLESGANGFFSKEDEHTVFLEAVSWLLHNPDGTWLAPEMHRRMLHTEKILKSKNITHAEKNILRFITLSNKEIADKLSISESTVKKHLWSIFQKLGIESRQEALNFAVSAQLLKLHPRYQQKE